MKGSELARKLEALAELWRGRKDVPDSEVAALLGATFGLPLAEQPAVNPRRQAAAKKAAEARWRQRVRSIAETDTERIRDGCGARAQPVRSDAQSVRETCPEMRETSPGDALRTAEGGRGEEYPESGLPNKFSDLASSYSYPDLRNQSPRAECGADAETMRSDAQRCAEHAQVPCPADLRLNDAQRANLRMNMGLDDAQIDALVSANVTAWLGDPAKRLPPAAWPKYLAKAVASEATNPLRRPERSNGRGGRESADARLQRQLARVAELEARERDEAI